MDITLQPGKLRGNVTAIPSKSMAHRLLICAALADKPTQLICQGSSMDIDATIACLQTLGANIEKTGNVIYDIEKAGVQPFTLVAGTKEGTKAFEFSYNNTIYYPYYASGLKMRTSVNDAASWTIEIDENGEASISTVSSSKTYLIKFNSATSSLTFTCYLSTATNATKAENAVSIYKKQVK